MKKYVIGAAFSKDKSKVVLIKKNRPDWQAGKYNLVGGKLEHFDASTLDAQVREFQEETGVFIPPNEWAHFASLSDAFYTWEISIFKAFTDDIFKVETVTDEIVYIMDTDKLPFESCIYNLSWLLPMALEDRGVNIPAYTIIDNYIAPTPFKLKKKPARTMEEVDLYLDPTLQDNTLIVDDGAIELRHQVGDTQVGRILRNLIAENLEEAARINYPVVENNGRYA